MTNYWIMDYMSTTTQFRTKEEADHIIEISQHEAEDIMAMRDKLAQTLAGKEHVFIDTDLTESQKRRVGNYNVALGVREVLDRGAWKNETEKARMFMQNHILFDYVCKNLKY